MGEMRLECGFLPDQPTSTCHRACVLVLITFTVAARLPVLNKQSEPLAGNPVERHVMETKGERGNQWQAWKCSPQMLPLGLVPKGDP